MNKDGSACGIDGDLALLNGSTDHLELEMMGLINSKIVPVCSRFVRIHVESLNSAESKPICVVDVDPAPGPAFLKGEATTIFSSELAISLYPQP